MAGFWPLYSNFVTKSQVTLALPGKPSNISKSVGGNFPALLLVPNVDFLIAFIKGNIGIADAMTKAAMVKNLNSPIAANDEMVARHFSKVNKLGLEEKMDTYKDKSGKIKIPKGDIALSSENDSLGFKAMEKTILQSIFETQKPYMEIAKMVIDVMISIEDIVARVMPLLAPPPPINIATSDKPVGNAGSGKRPAAIGYQKGAVIKKAIAELDKIAKAGGKLTVNKDGSTSKTPAPLTDDEKDAKYGEGASDFSDLQNAKLRELGKKWQIVNAVYSTGDYDPTVDYEYTYKDIVEEEPKEGEAPEDEEDPYDKYKPKRIILGMFDSNGVPMDPNSKLKTIGAYGAVETNISKASWVLNSSKWVFPKSTSPGALVWPSFGTPIYTWERLGGLDKKNSKTQPSSSDPMPSYSLKKYKSGDKNLLSGMDAIEGDPVISGFDPVETSTYMRYFTEYTTINMNMAEDLTDAEKKESTNTIMSQLNVVSHLENVNLYGQSKTTYYKDFTLFNSMKVSFMPMQITVEEAKNDPKLAGLNGKIWIDPESDYEMKIIQVKPVTKIAYSAAKGEPEVQVDIKSFVKNMVVFQISGNRKFNIDITKNGYAFESFKDLEKYTLENWNYDSINKSFNNWNNYQVDIWSENPGGWIESHFNSNTELYMNRSNGRTKQGDYEILITKSNGVYSYKENQYTNEYVWDGQKYVYTGYNNYTARQFWDGVKKLGDGTVVYVEGGIIKKWLFLYRKEYSNSTLPPFGVETTLTLDLNNIYENYISSPYVSSCHQAYANSSDRSIPLYQQKVTNGSFPYGAVIDPSKILNGHLMKDELYSTGGYGIGSRETPQELGTIYRYALTDLDEETYYIIEGIKVDDNDQSITGDGDGDPGGARDGVNTKAKKVSGSGGGSYKFPHAIGAVVVFLKMLVKVFSKLIPAIMKLLKLFSNPMAFVTDIIMEKLGESFSVFSPEAKKKFDGASKLVKEKKKYNKPKPPTVPGRPTPHAPNMGDYVRKMKGHFENSPLKNHVAVDSLGSFKDASGKIPKTPSKEAIGNFKFVYDGVGFIPFKIFGKDLSFGMELKMANIITKEWGNPSPMKLIFNKEKNSKDPNNIGVTGPKTDDGNNADSKDAAMAEANTDPNSNGKANQGLNGSTDPNKRYVTLSTWYSTGEFINGVDYKYVYIDQQDEDLLKQVDELSGSIDPDDLKKAKDLLQEALDKDPDDDALKNKLDEIKKKMFDLNSNTQPLLKMILGIVTLPIKIVAGIIEWLMKFFKSLTNPIALPGKIIEFLSFKWIMEFFSPTGILKMAGVNFDPSLPAQWMSKVNQVNPNKNLSPEEMKKKAEGKAKDAKGQVVDKPADIKGKAGDSAAKTKGDAANAKDVAANAKDAAGKAKGVSPADAKAAGAEKIPKVDKDIPLHKGSYAMPDDFELADLSKFLNVAFLAQLPTYTTKDMREQGKNIPKRVFSPIICFIEKLINGIIDFIWSLLGIECIIPPPHIKLCKSDDADTMDPEELNKLLNGETPGSGEGGTPAADINFKTQIVATDPEVSVQSPPLEMYVYEITLPDGKVVRATDREELDKFIQENRDLGYDFQF
jgi:hypothetical protein